MIYLKFRLFGVNSSSCQIFSKNVICWLSSTKESREPLQLRINKAIPSLSRRRADDAIKNNRVTVNGKYPHLSLQVTPTDIIRFDGIVQHPKFYRATSTEIKNDSFALMEDTSLAPHNGVDNKITSQTYIKMWKTNGITCTTDTEVENNIIDFGQFKMRGVVDRLFPVGRLDKNTSGLILITSDGHFMHSLLGVQSHVKKVYKVTTRDDLTDKNIEELSKGVIITTTTTTGKIITAPTLPCKVIRNHNSRTR